MNQPTSRVLLVDDRESNLSAMREILQGLADDVISARSGEEALRWCLKHDFAAILMDVRMPGMDGFEAASLIRQREPLRQTPILFITAYDKRSVDVLKGYAMGAVDYIFKPIEPEILRSKVTVFVDLHRSREQQKLLAEELAAKASELERSNLELEQFAHVAAHDLREPLRTMRSYVELIAERLGDSADPKVRKYVEHVVGGSERMRALIDDLLEYARLERQRKPLAAVSLDEVLDAALAGAEAGIREARAEIVRGPLPGVIGDRAQLVRVFENLVGNAVKFRGDAPPRIRVEGEERGREAVISVADNGIGVPAKDSERIFGLFERLHARTRYPGTGLGLAICKKIVERHGGRIWVESEPGQGSTFVFTLPMSTVQGRRDGR
jgi:signal transduction histidine kinase